MEFLIIEDTFFNIYPRTGNLLSRQISKTKTTHQLDFLANGVMSFFEEISLSDPKPLYCKKI